jgi:cytochrome b subunit of formate dehydrogenase
MNWLLISVFGFFGLHMLLWFQRSAVAVTKGEVPRRWSSGKYVLRFHLPHRITHVTLVISFLGLAATGLPLMYNYTAWGRILEGILGGVEVTRYFHRFFAIVTLGYISFHVGYMLDKLFLKGSISLLYGPNSMIPRRRGWSISTGTYAGSYTSVLVRNSTGGLIGRSSITLRCSGVYQ